MYVLLGRIRKVKRLLETPYIVYGSTAPDILKTKFRDKASTKLGLSMAGVDEILYLPYGIPY